jgi:Tfp pilus assembly protein PilV
MNNFHKKKKNLKELGLTLIEALVSTALVGIGFVAIFQMVNYSVQSIDVSSERTKANYLVSMIAEDIIGNKNTLHSSGSKFSKYLTENRIMNSACIERPRNKSELNTFYKDQKNNAPENKIQKWTEIFKSQKLIKCGTAGAETKNIKTVRIFDMCKSGCTVTNESVFDKMYIGRIQININNGKKRKYLYFQSNYEINQNEDSVTVDDSSETESEG